MTSLHDFATWEPLLRLLRAGNAEKLAAPGSDVAGQIGRRSWSVPLHRRFPAPGRAAQVGDMQAEFDAVGRVQAAMTDAGIDSISFTVKISPTGRSVLRLLGPSPAVEPGISGPQPGSLILVEDAVPDRVAGARYSGGHGQCGVGLVALGLLPVPPAPRE